MSGTALPRTGGAKLSQVSEPIVVAAYTFV